MSFKGRGGLTASEGASGGKTRSKTWRAGCSSAPELLPPPRRERLCSTGWRGEKTVVTRIGERGVRSGDVVGHSGVRLRVD